MDSALVGALALACAFVWPIFLPQVAGARATSSTFDRPAGETATNPSIALLGKPQKRKPWIRARFGPASATVLGATGMMC